VKDKLLIIWSFDRKSKLKEISRLKITKYLNLTR
jgi:hypothetical protein